MTPWTENEGESDGQDRASPTQNAWAARHRIESITEDEVEEVLARMPQLPSRGHNSRRGVRGGRNALRNEISLDEIDEDEVEELSAVEAGKEAALGSGSGWGDASGDKEEGNDEQTKAIGEQVADQGAREGGKNDKAEVAELEPEIRSSPVAVKNAAKSGSVRVIRRMSTKTVAVAAGTTTEDGTRSNATNHPKVADVDPAGQPPRTSALLSKTTPVQSSVASMGTLGTAMSVDSLAVPPLDAAGTAVSVSASESAAAPVVVHTKSSSWKSQAPSPERRIAGADRESVDGGYSNDDVPALTLADAEPDDMLSFDLPSVTGSRIAERDSINMRSLNESFNALKDSSIGGTSLDGAIGTRSKYHDSSAAYDPFEESPSPKKATLADLDLNNPGHTNDSLMSMESLSGAGLEVEEIVSSPEPGTSRGEIDSHSAGAGKTKVTTDGLRTGVLKFIKGRAVEADEDTNGDKEGELWSTGGAGATSSTGTSARLGMTGTGSMGDTGGVLFGATGGSGDGVLMATLTVPTADFASTGGGSGDGGGDALDTGSDSDGAPGSASLGLSTSDLEVSTNTEEAKEERHRAFQEADRAKRAQEKVLHVNKCQPGRSSGPVAFAGTRASKDEIYAGNALEFIVSAVRLEDDGPLGSVGTPQVHLVTEFLGATSDQSTGIPVTSGAPLVQTDFACHISFTRAASTVLADELDSAGEGLCALLYVISPDQVIHASAEVSLWSMVEEGAPIVRQEIDLFSAGGDLAGSAVVDVRGHYLFTGLV